MVAETKGAGEVPCPDPSAHQASNKLADQASSAALYVTDPARGTTPKDDVLGSDGKLSSKSAATSLKYANARDLPSFPTVGVRNAGTSNTAANLANANQSSPSYWKPDGYSSVAGKAAILAQKDGGKLDLWMPEASKEGNSAAGIAMRNKTLSPQLDYGYTPDGRSRALLAATMSINEGRRRAGSTPAAPLPAYPDSRNSAHNALSAATVSHRGSVRQTDSNRIDSDAMQAARFQNNHMSRDMFTEHPPVQPEVDEKNHNAALRAAAVGMAKQMYEVQNRTVPSSDLTSTLGASAAHQRNPSTTQPDIKSEALKYIHLQEAAQKLAAERLAKVDSTFDAARYRDYYYEKSPPPRSRLSLKGRGRRRASSEANKEDVDSDDDLTSRRIRHQMSGLNKSLADVDEKKKQRDRTALLAAAEKRVQSQMHDMDEKVFLETGKVPPAMMEEWERKAREKADKNRDGRADANKGKVHLGGGKYMDQSEIDAIAQSRLQPTLDEINDTADKKRAHDEEVRLDRAEQDRQRMSQKQKDREEKDEQKRIRNDEKTATRAERTEKKQIDRVEKDSRKAREAEEKRIQKEEKRKSKGLMHSEETETAETAEAGAAVTGAPLIGPAETGAAVTGATLIGSAEIPAVEEPEKEGTRDVGGEDADKLPRMTSEHSALQTDALPVTDSTAATKTEIDRHITNIPDDSDDDEIGGPVPTEDDGVAKAPATPSGATPTPASAKIGPRDSEETPKSDSKGLKGLFSKLKNRRSKPDNKPTEPKTSGEEKEKGFIGGSALTGATSSAGPSSLPNDAATLPQHDLGGKGSASSLRRHDASPHEVSSLSSSDLDEAGATRGRTGRSSAILDKGKAKAVDVTGDKKNSGEKAGVEADKDSDEDEFEEARDNFDESLAPPPAFGGQAKSESPVRETRFQENL